jgi:heme exporter protein D
VTFDGFAAFLEMGGHGFYVWLSYGAGLIIVLYNVLSVRIATHRFFRDARDRQRRSPRTFSRDAVVDDPAAGDEDL